MAKSLEAALRRFKAELNASGLDITPLAMVFVTKLEADTRDLWEVARALRRGSPLGPQLPDVVDRCFR